MDVATRLVQAYLHVNGYLTATDYPLVASVYGSAPRAITDIDMLAVRLGRAGGKRPEAKSANVHGPLTAHTDPALKCRDEHTDMIVAEIKQGGAHFNSAARDHKVLAAALTRFGCCDEADAPRLVQELLQHGHVQAENNHDIRMVVFASHEESTLHGWHWVPLGHVVLFLDKYLRAGRQELGAVDLHDQALSWLSLLRKCKLALKPEIPTN